VGGVDMSDGTCKTCPWFASGRGGRVYREESDRWVGADAAVTNTECERDAAEAELARRDRMLDIWWEWETHHGINPSMSKAAWLTKLRDDPYARAEEGGRGVRTFTMYRRAVPTDTHDENQRNAADEPQFQGVVFDDGTVAIRWQTAKRSTSVWDSMDDMLAIHGHPEYGSELVWAEVELAALKGQECEGCEHDIEGVACQCGQGVSVDGDIPSTDFACNRWTARAEEGGES